MWNIFLALSLQKKLVMKNKKSMGLSQKRLKRNNKFRLKKHKKTCKRHLRNNGKI